jgi:hypothetical protein
MTDKNLEIPRYGNSGASFLGAEFKDCLLLLASIPVAMGAANWSAWAYVVVPAVGYLLNRQYLEWLASGPPGRLRLWLYELAIVGYSDAHSTRDCLFVGDARVINPAASELIELRQLQLASEQAQRNSAQEAPHGA